MSVVPGAAPGWAAVIPAPITRVSRAHRADRPTGPTTGTATGADPATATAIATVPTAAINKSQGLAVYNGAGTAGLAGRVSSIVQADGWTLGQVGNWGGTPQQTSVIFYAGAAQQANAEALSKLLNIPTIVNSTEFQVPLVVVLGPGFK